MNQNFVIDPDKPVREAIESLPEIYSFKLSGGIPYRTLTYPEKRNSPMFYNGRDKLPIRTQEQILRDYSYLDIDLLTSRMPN